VLIYLRRKQPATTEKGKQIETGASEEVRSNSTADYGSATEEWTQNKRLISSHPPMDK
jgi:hypothetical protein